MATERETFADVVRELIGNQTQREFAAAADVSHTYVNDWLQNRVPALRTAVRVADRLHLPPSMRERWFRAAGYVDPGPDFLRKGKGRTGATPLLDPDRALDALEKHAENQAQELTYEPDLEGVTAELYEGLQQLSPEARRNTLRIIQMINERHRRKQGRD